MDEADARLVAVCSQLGPSVARSALRQANLLAEAESALKDGANPNLGGVSFYYLFCDCFNFGCRWLLPIRFP